MLALAGFALVRLASRLRGRVGVAWRYGVANLARRRAESVVQIVALGLGLSALLLLAVIRGDLIADWRESLPADCAQLLLRQHPAGGPRGIRGVPRRARAASCRAMLPMIRGRMTQINGEPVTQRRASESARRGLRAARAEPHLGGTRSGRTTRSPRATGSRAADTGKPLVSVATDFQESMQLKLGDRLTFDIAGETFEVTITSFRDVQWDSLQPNFFLMFPPGLLDGTAGTWMASAQFRPTDPATIAQLVRQFPSVSIFDMDDLLAQVRSMIDKAVLAVQSVFLFTLLAGMVVLLAAVQATRDERRYESAMLRTLGAQRRHGAGRRAGRVRADRTAGGAARRRGRFHRRLLPRHAAAGDPVYDPNPLLWLTGALAGALLVCLAG